MLVITQLWNVAKLKQAFFDLKQHFHKIFASRYLILNISKLCSSSVGYKTLTKSQTSLPTVTTGTFSRHSSKMQKTIVLLLLYVHTLLQEHSGIATIKEQWCTLWSYCANAIVSLSGESAVELPYCHRKLCKDHSEHTHRLQGMYEDSSFCSLRCHCVSTVLVRLLKLTQRMFSVSNLHRLEERLRRFPLICDRNPEELDSKAWVVNVTSQSRKLYLLFLAISQHCEKLTIAAPTW